MPDIDYIVFSQIPDIVFAKYGLMLTGCFKIWSHKGLTHDKRPVEKAILLFLFFWIFKFDITFVKNLLKKNHNMYFQSSSTSQNLLLWKPSIVK